MKLNHIDLTHSKYTKEECMTIAEKYDFTIRITQTIDVDYFLFTEHHKNRRLIISVIERYNLF